MNNIDKKCYQKNEKQRLKKGIKEWTLKKEMM